MNRKESRAVEGLGVFTPDVFHDFRGEYVETWNHKDWPNVFVQDDISVSRKHVLRGLHGDAHTVKLVQCLHGAFYLAVVDCRRGSQTFGNVETFTLNDKGRQQVLIPAGCANGHLCLTETCIFGYKQSALYAGPEQQFTLRLGRAHRLLAGRRPPAVAKGPGRQDFHGVVLS